MTDRRKVYLVVGLLSAVLTGCGQPSGPAGDEVTKNVEKIKEDEKGNPMSETRTPEERAAIDKAAQTPSNAPDISGIAFAAGPLPDNLSGKEFFSTETTGGHLSIGQDRKATFFPFNQSEISCSYEVDNADPPSITFVFERGGSKRAAIYTVSRGESFALLNLSEPCDPWPQLMKGAVE